MENGKSHLQRVQDEAEEVKVIMQDNLNKAKERAENLEELEERAEELQQKAKEFKDLTVKVKARYAKRAKEHKNLNVKAFVAVAVVLLIIVIIILLLATGAISNSSTLYPIITPTSEP